MTSLELRISNCSTWLFAWFRRISFSFCGSTRTAWSGLSPMGSVASAEEESLSFVISGTHFWSFKTFLTGLPRSMIDPSGDGVFLEDTVRDREIPSSDFETGLLKTEGSRVTSAIVCTACKSCLEGVERSRLFDSFRVTRVFGIGDPCSSTEGLGGTLGGTSGRVSFGVCGDTGDRGIAVVGVVPWVGDKMGDRGLVMLNVAGDS